MRQTGFTYQIHKYCYNNTLFNVQIFKLQNNTLFVIARLN